MRWSQSLVHWHSTMSQALCQEKETWGYVKHSPRSSGTHRQTRQRWTGTSTSWSDRRGVQTGNTWWPSIVFCRSSFPVLIRKQQRVWRFLLVKNPVLRSPEYLRWSPFVKCCQGWYVVVSLLHPSLLILVTTTTKIPSENFSFSVSSALMGC